MELSKLQPCVADTLPETKLIKKWCSIGGQVSHVVPASWPPFQTGDRPMP